MNLAFNASRMIGSKVLIIGDIMLDQYQKGVVERISPEAPVPIVTVTEQTFRIGGAGNVAQNISTLGGIPTLVSVCGEDQSGTDLEEMCASLKIENHLVRSHTRQTTLKTRIMAAHQQMLRVDRETTRALDNQEFGRLIEKIDGIIDRYSTIILSDYGKGVIAGDFLKWFAGRRKKEQKVILDPKTCNFPFYSDLYSMTPNTKEAAEGAEMSIKGRDDVIIAGQKLIKKHKLETLVITLGADGMAVFLPEKGVFHLPTMAKKVFDVTGAGDTVIAVIALALSAGLDLLNASILANCAAGLVVGHVGAVGITQEELTAALGTWTAVNHDRWCDL